MSSPTLYVPYTQNLFGNLAILVRTQATRVTVTSGLRSAVWEIDPSLPVDDVMSMEQLRDEGFASPRFNAIVAGLLAALALVLSAIGIYGVLSYTVQQENRNTGIRMALGASRSAVVRLVIRQAMQMVATGLIVGALLSVATLRLISSLFFKVGPFNATTFLTCTLVLAFTGLIAAWIPAQAAAGIDPNEAIREL